MQTQTPFHELPLYQQMEQLPETGPTPEPGRVPQPPMGRLRTAAPTEPVPSHGPTGAAVATPTSTPITPANEFTPDQMEWMRRNNFTPETIARLRTNIVPGGGQPPIRPMASHTPTVEPTAPMAEPAAPQSISPPDIAEQEARFNRGSERHAREAGLTRAESQARTDSAQGTRSETSQVAPWEPQQRMMATMDALEAADPTGRSIVDYIDKAKDPKTKEALMNWERMRAYMKQRAPFYAVAGAAVAPSIRDELLRQMRSGVTGRDAEQP